jgi:hypothetical protein
MEFDGHPRDSDTLSGSHAPIKEGRIDRVEPLRNRVVGGAASGGAGGDLAALTAVA